MDQMTTSVEKSVPAVGQVPCRLYHPSPSGFGNNPSNPHPPSGQAHDKPNVVANQANGRPNLDGEEIGGRQHLPVRAQEFLGHYGLMWQVPYIKRRIPTAQYPGRII
jgi:hypothetical protein